MNQTITSKSRYLIVDQIRGFAVLLMIFFHLFYDLNMFKVVEIDFLENQFWFLLPRLIVFLFLLTVGISLCLTHKFEISFKAVKKRFIKIALFALLISIVTYLLYPDNWVYFGTLHCIALCSIAGLPFIKRPNISIILGVGILAFHTLLDIQIPWIILPIASMDYIPFFPWIGVTLLGIFCYHHGIQHIKVPFKKIWFPIEFMGKHAFFIYLIHQPILICLSWPIAQIINSK